ncbi:MAG TPA: hypothetical protein VLL97_00460, partial [Acidobacteriota bacterium]|nr:hypothetical protein [Acidobacteriota bacterium]
YTGGTGRMSNSGTDPQTTETTRWTNFSQPCDTADASDVKSLIEAGLGNPQPIIFGQGIGTTNGVEAGNLGDLRKIFLNRKSTEPWSMTLPVIDCPDQDSDPNKVRQTCSPFVGVVNVSIVWISDKDKPEKDGFPPPRMGNWTCPASCVSSEREICCWNDFVSHFNLKNVDNLAAVYAKNSIYFVPSTTATEPTGATGGQNFGVLAKTPVLVN